MDADLTAWIGKPPEKSQSQEPRSQQDDQPSEESTREQSAAASDSSSDAVEVNYDGTPAKKPTQTLTMRDIERSDDEDKDGSDDDDSLIEVIPQFANKFFIDVPKMDEDEKEEYDYMPGHFSVQRILSDFRGDRYLIKLESGEKQMVSLMLLVAHN